ncbi:C-type lectin domain family 4 member D [Brachionus plicatilis]|uniref:C-type lectin domain family 4 member D n=1 Tax=Brachionus plicatilis TaxID=10195 RepID=A0A3M7QE46_BRAPC|nr:C-type lectin domain family 4 member D [Brachionus plicatilis]
MFIKFISGLFISLCIVSYVSSIPPPFRAPKRHPSHCTKQHGERCFSGRECCDNLICQNRECRCLPGYTWSTEFSVCYQCPPGWTFFEDKCFMVVNQAATWQDALDDCRTRAGQLITFDSLVIVDQLNSFFSKLATNETYFVGAFSGNIPGNWSWMGEKFIPATGPWWSGCFEAQNENGTELFLAQGCAQANADGLTAVACNDPDLVNPYICELKTSRRIVLPKQDKKAMPKCKHGYNWNEKTKRCVKCPNRWTYCNDACYFISDRPESWQRARDFCNQSRAELFVSKSAVVIDEILPIFKSHNLPLDSYWIGASFDGTSFKWLDGRSLPDEGPMWSNCRVPSPNTATLGCVASFGISLENLSCSEAKKFICKIN